jgi:hypothetical protein
MLTISPARQGEFMVMSLVGRIDASNSKDLEEQCLDMISNGEIQIISVVLLYGCFYWQLSERELLKVQFGYVD